MSVTKDRLLADLKSVVTGMQQLADLAAQSGRDLTADETANLHSLKARADGLKNRIEQVDAEERLAKALGDIGDGPIPQDVFGRPQYQTTGSGSAWAKSVASKLTAAASRYGMKALTSGTIEIPAPVAPMVELPGRPTRVLDLIPRLPLSARTFEFIRQTVRTNNAAPVADGGTKPTSIYTVADVEGRARVFAHMSEPFPNRYFADVPELIRLIDGQMREDVLIALETNALSGDGTGENFTGILETSGIIAQAWSSNIVTTTRKAKTALEAVFQRPTAYVMNPADWETIDLLQDNENRYYYGGPATSATPTLHGLPVVVSPAIAAGTGLLGDFSQARLWVREDMQLAADSSGDLFETNRTRLRVEGRWGFGVLRPAAFVEIDLTA